MAKQHPSADTLVGRIARFDQLEVVAAQAGHSLPQDVADLIWARKLLPVITRSDAAEGPFGTQAPIVGAGDMSITYAVAPPGTGPTLHAHRKTFETFTVMRGRFEFSVGDEGEEKVVLEPLDAVSVPPGVHRAFRNVSDEEGVLQVIITGGAHDQKDVYFPTATAARIAEKDPKHLTYFKSIGLYFETDNQ